jgi:hypothetical protein
MLTYGHCQLDLTKKTKRMKMTNTIGEREHGNVGYWGISTLSSFPPQKFRTD